LEQEKNSEELDKRYPFAAVVSTSCELLQQRQRIGNNFSIDSKSCPCKIQEPIAQPYFFVRGLDLVVVSARSAHFKAAEVRGKPMMVVISRMAW
jgi:hypothetical protein